jgi:hypothetical protein
LITDDQDLVLFAIDSGKDLGSNSYCGGRIGFWLPLQDLERGGVVKNNMYDLSSVPCSVLATIMDRYLCTSIE